MMKMGKQDITRKNALKVFDWCKKTFGISTINGPYPKFIFHRTGKEIAGLYDPWKNEIHVWKERHRTFLGFIGTIIHEYTHYHQSIKRKYVQLEQYYSYKNHPMEREANKVEKRDKKKCFNEVFGDLS